MRKKIKWATKLPIKRIAMGKRREREKKSKFWLMRKPKKEKKLLNYGNYIQLADV